MLIFYFKALPSTIHKCTFPHEILLTELTEQMRENHPGKKLLSSKRGQQAQGEAKLRKSSNL